MLLRGQFSERGSERLRSNAPAYARPQVLAHYSRKQRVFFLKLLHLLQNLFSNLREHLFGDQHQRFTGDSVYPACFGKPLRGVADFVVQPRGAGDNLFVSEAEDRALRHGRENLFATSALQGFEIGHSSRVAQCRPPRERIEDCSASDRDHRGKLPQDETVPAQHEDFVLQLQIREGAAAGLPFPFPVKKNLSDGFLGPRVKMNARSVLHFSPRS